MWIGGDFVMLVMLVVLFAGAARSKRPLDGGAWVEAARVNSLAGGALAVSGQPQVDDDDAQLAAYNSYLQNLGNHDPALGNQRRDGHRTPENHDAS